MTKNNSSLKMESRDQPGFETLVAMISAHFISVSADAVDAEIVEVQRLVCEHFKLDACFLWQWDANESDILMMTHVYRSLDGPPIPERMEASEYFPWSLQKMMAGEVIALSSLEDAPVEAARDVDICRQLGIKSTIAIPLATGDRPTFGAVGFNSMKQERLWTELVVQRLQLIADSFANVLVRKLSDKLLQASGRKLERQLNFERLLSDLACEVSLADTAAIDTVIDLTLHRVAEFSGADRVCLYRFNPSDKHLCSAHFYEQSEMTVVLRLDPHVEFPWLWKKLHAGEAVAISRMSDLPEAARIDRESFQHYGVGSHLSVPVCDGGTVKFVLAFGFTQEGMLEPEALHMRLTTFAHLLAGTIVRTELELSRNENEGFERMLTEVSARLCQATFGAIDRVITGVLQTVRTFFAFDMVGIQEFPSLFIVFSDYANDVPQITHQRDRRELYPWLYEKLIAGEMVVMNTAEIPETAQTDREYFQSAGFKSFAGLPLGDGAGMRYMLSFVDIHGERHRWEKYASRLRLLGSMLVSCLHRKRAWSDLAQSERSLLHAQSLAHVGSWEWDIITNELKWSVETRRILDVALNTPESTYDVFQACVHPSDREIVDKAAYQALEIPGKSLDVQNRVVRPDGSERIVRLQADVVRGPQDEPLSMVGSLQDITEQSLIKAESSRLHLELAHLGRMTTASVMTGALAHEINQPLTAILSNAQVGLRLLNSGDVDRDDLLDLFRDIVQNDKRAGEVIRRLRRMLAKRAPQREELNLSDTALEVARFLHSQVLAEKVLLDLDLAPQLPVVMADSVQVQQIILNLLLNAFEAVHEEPPAGRRVVLKTHANAAGQVLLTVSDFGRGIPQDQLSTIFEPFQSRKSGGMGLGLAICRHIAREYGGTLVAGNGPDGGGQFVLTLPSVDS